MSEYENGAVEKAVNVLRKLATRDQMVWRLAEPLEITAGPNQTALTIPAGSWVLTDGSQVIASVRSDEG